MKVLDYFATVLGLVLGVVTFASAEGQLRNISTLGFVNEAGLAAGFIIEGTESRTVVILGERFQSGIDAAIRVTDLGGSRTFGENRTWTQADRRNEMAGIIGRQPANDSDAALILTLDPGVYVAFLESSNGQFGDGIIAVTVGAAPGVARYAGNYRGSFVGGDFGTFDVEIYDSGQIEGVAVARYAGRVGLSGSVSSSGLLSVSSGSGSNGVRFLGQLLGSRIEGVWGHPQLGAGGTFSGSRQ